MFLRLAVGQVEKLKAGDLSLLRWSNGSTVSVVRKSHEFEFCFRREGAEIRQAVTVTRLACPFGGTRALFLCPRCWRRCRWLYVYRVRFICRRCTGVRYWTQTASPDVWWPIGSANYGLAWLRKWMLTTTSLTGYPRRPLRHAAFYMPASKGTRISVDSQARRVLGAARRIAAQDCGCREWW